jgi:hypothetical protein
MGMHREWCRFNAKSHFHGWPKSHLVERDALPWNRAHFLKIVSHFLAPLKGSRMFLQEVLTEEEQR